MATYSKAAIMAVIDAQIINIKTTQLVLDKKNVEALEKARANRAVFIATIGDDIIAYNKMLINRAKEIRWWQRRKFENKLDITIQELIDRTSSGICGPVHLNSGTVQIDPTWPFMLSINNFIEWYEELHGKDSYIKSKYRHASLASYDWKIGNSTKYVVDTENMLLMLRNLIGCYNGDCLEDSDINHQINIICSTHVAIEFEDRSFDII